MEREGLVRRLEHPTDARALFVELTDYGEQMMDSYFSETLTAER
jgi:DNA-binding MarR family transcriptional regulator